MSTTTSKRNVRQLIAYVDEETHSRILSLAQASRRSNSYVVNEIIHYGYEQAEKNLAASFRKPTQDAHSEHHDAA